jgi:hypothetical protein
VPVPVANGAVAQHHPRRLVHRQLVPVRRRGGGVGGTGREVLEVEQVGAGVAALLVLVVLVAVHLHPVEQHPLQLRHPDLHPPPLAAGRRRRRLAVVAVQEPHGPLRLAPRGRRLAEAGARVRRRRGARGGLRAPRRRRRRRAPAAEDGVQEPRQPRAGGRRLAQVPQLGADVGAGLLLLLRRGRRRGRGRRGRAHARAYGPQPPVLRRLRLRRREPTVARAFGGARRGGGGVRRRPAAAVAPRQRRLVVVAVVQVLVALHLGRSRGGGGCCPVAGLVHGLVYGVEERGREGRLVGVPPQPPRRRNRRPPVLVPPPLHHSRRTDTQKQAWRPDATHGQPRLQAERVQSQCKPLSS